MRRLHARIEALEARVNAPQEEGFRERWWRAIEQAQNDNEPDPEGARLVLTGEAAAAVLCWWEVHGAAPTDTSPQAVLQVLEVACPCPRETAAL